MIRHATVFWVAVAGLFLTALTVVGSEVRDRDFALATLQSAIVKEQTRIHVLNAERAYLASPERIAVRAERDLDMALAAPAQVVDIASLPVWTPAPELQIEPERTRPLLLSAYELPLDDGADTAAGATGGFLAGERAAQFPTLTRPGMAGMLRDASWTGLALERESE